MALPRPLKEDRLALRILASLLQAIDHVISLAALRPQAVSQAPQHFRSSETQAICDGCMLYTQAYLLGCDMAVLLTPIMSLTSTLTRPPGEKRAT